MKRMADYYLRKNSDDVKITGKISGNDQLVSLERKRLLEEGKKPNNAKNGCNGKEDEHLTATYWG